ncbi:MAG: hypothetical protein ACJ79E_01765 [Anaeromyxobacteraceae bacterium]
MTPRLRPTLLAALAIATSFVAARADAIPAFARKYGTSCLTCHTVYPKLGPFGEAFRRNGYRFPGIDSDQVKAETIPLGQDATKKTFPASVWPAVIPASVPIAIGANGRAVVIPSSTSTAGRGARPGTVVSLQDLVAEGQLWAGAAVDDSITLWGEISFAGSAEVEHAQILFGDLLGPRHAVNLVVGRGFPNVTPFGPHSSYLADVMLPNAPVGALLGNGSAWQLVDNYDGVELNGVLAGRFDYALGVNAGATGGELRAPTEDVYGRVGVKVGGMRQDGEGANAPRDALHPWAETALHLYAFGYRTNTFLDPATAPPGAAPNDVGTALGIGARLQLASLELDLGWYRDRHGHGTDAGTPATARVGFGELSYVVFPWLVPALRVENLALDVAGAPGASAWHVMPGVACLIRPNIKLVVAANWEHADGFPSSAAAPGTLFPWSGGSGDVGAFTIAPGPGATSPRATSSELETIAFFVAWAI